MLTLTDIKDYIKKECKLNTAYVGRIDAKKENCVGVYNLKPSQNKRRPFKKLKAYDVKGISLLVHGSTSKSATEALAQSIYDKLDSISTATIKDTSIIDLQLLQNEPVDVDYDSNNIYEYVIEFLLIMEV